MQVEIRCYKAMKLKPQFHFHEVPKELKKKKFHSRYMTTKEKVVPVSATTWQLVMIACHGDTAIQDLIC